MTSIEFLIHYDPCPKCGYRFTTGDRYPAVKLSCPICCTVTLNRIPEIKAFFNLMTTTEKRYFAKLLRRFAMDAEHEAEAESSDQQEEW